MLIYEYLMSCCWMGMFSKLQVKIAQPPRNQIDGENNTHFMINSKICTVHVYSAVYTLKLGRRLNMGF